MIGTLFLLALTTASAYQIGAGIYDMTGPSVEINFMGYALPSQRGEGIHQRLRARAFYMADDDSRVVFVSLDGGMGSDLVNTKVVERLAERVGVGIFTIENICISGTHTHSGPAGVLQYVLFQVTSLGFVDETFDAWVDAITNAIVMAYENSQPGKLFVSQGKLQNTNINRSPTSYLLNPEEERAKYEDGDTDKNMLLVKMVAEDGSLVGVFNWFAVHGTSMNNTNHLVSGDNKGYASYLLEKEINGPDAMPGMGPFVSAFASTNLGDVSPNTAGAKCIDTGLPCEPYHSTCNGRTELCIAFGPGTDGDMFESTEIIGRQQFDHATSLLESPGVEITGPVDFRHSFVDMPSLKVKLEDGSTTQLCESAMGYSFAAGTTDGPGALNFTQGTTTGNPFWDKVSGFLSTPTEEEKACQAPKPILLNTGDVQRPYAWDPSTVSIQVLRIGQLIIAAPPAEFTTMSGRRLRQTIRDTLVSSGAFAEDDEVFVTLAGLSNGYSSYVTTFDEYQAQRYEAASTLYGPHTLHGYQQEFARIVEDLSLGRPSASDAPTPDLYDEQLKLTPPGAPYDSTPVGKKFGEVVKDMDVRESYLIGEEVSATFHSANPRRNQRAQGTYLTVEKQEKTGVFKKEWKVVAVDGHWETKFVWKGGKEDPLDLGLFTRSKATVQWAIPKDAEEGTYRLCHQGDSKNKEGEITSFSGCSSEFIVKVA